MPELGIFVVWAVVAGCFVTGLTIWFCSKTYRTCAGCLFLLGGVLAAYRLLLLLHGPEPKLAGILFWCFTGLLLLFLLTALVTGGALVRVAVTKPERNIPFLVVLGCVVKGTRPTRSLQDRLIAAAEYLQENPATRCIVSGGLGEGAEITEAECMRRELTAMGIDRERIILEDRSRNTWQNLQFSADLIEKITGSRPESVGILSSEYHMFRTGQMAKKQGLQMKPVPARTGKFILRLNYTLREIAAVWRMILRI